MGSRASHGKDGVKKGVMVRVQTLIIKVIHFMIIHILMTLSAKQGLILLFSLNKIIANLINNLAIKYESGIHPKHRITQYHEFFVKNISSGDLVLDLGCGNGYLSYQMALAGAIVYGIDKRQESIQYASEHFFSPNLLFICFDFTNRFTMQRLKIRFPDILVLSNVLEHIDDRISALKRFLIQYPPRKILIRVPLLTRSWEVPFMQELEIDYRSDDSHFIEYTERTIKHELFMSGLDIVASEVRWGELYLVAVPQG